MAFIGAAVPPAHAAAVHVDVAACSRKSATAPQLSGSATCGRRRLPPLYSVVGRSFVTSGRQLWRFTSSASRFQEPVRLRAAADANQPPRTAAPEQKRAAAGSKDSGAADVQAPPPPKKKLVRGYGIRYWDVKLERQGYHPIIPVGQEYPTEAPIEILLKASRAGQEAVELVFGELSPKSKVASNEVFFDSAGKILTQEAEDQDQYEVGPVTAAEGAPQEDPGRVVIPLEPVGKLGPDRLRVYLEIGADAVLRVSVQDMATLAEPLIRAPVCLCS
eukprot:tig00001265_g7901.t1